MPTKSFTYIALDKAGARRTGSLVAATETQVRERLTKQGFLVEFVGEGSQQAVAAPAPVAVAATGSSVLGPFFSKVPYVDLSAFFRRLAGMLKSGISMHKALTSLEANTGNKRLSKAIAVMRERAADGRPLSDAMEEFPYIFSPLQTALVRAGEKGGTLDKNLEKLNDYLQREIQLRNTVRVQTLYPKLLLAVALFIVIATNTLITFIADKTGGPRMYLNLPFGSIWLLVAVIVGFILLRFVDASPRLRPTWQKFLLSIPYFGSTIHMLAMAKFSRTFAALIGAGVSPQETIKLSAAACGNEYLSRQIMPAANSVSDGRSIALALANTGVFSDTVLEMLATGEQTGDMEGMLDHAADYYEAEGEARVQNSTKVAMVLVVLMIVLMVGYVIVSFWMNYVPRVTQYAE
jgi:type II secretory pathway component PulF